MCFFGRKKILRKQEELSLSIQTLATQVDNFSKETKELKDFFTSISQVSNSTLIGGINSTLQAVTENVANISANNEKRILEVKEQVTKDLESIRLENEKQLTAMRGVVEEKLTTSLNERLSSTVVTINERLDAVNKGLGELQSLSGGVSDLKKVLSNVKTRGVWGEVSLANILDGILTREQYVQQFNISGKRRGDDSGLVDFAIILPGKERGENVYLPIDAKFPSEDYQRLVDASERGDTEALDNATKGLISAVKREARSIRDNYIDPPKTTDFALMYLPTEGLYAEVIRIPGLCEELQGSLKVIPAGPTTVTALINSLQLGFRTLAVQKSSKEVFDLLMKFKQDFHLFVDQIGKVQGHLDGANKTLSEATKRTEIIMKKLEKVEGLSLPSPEEE